MKLRHVLAGIASLMAVPASATTFGLSYSGGGNELIYRLGTFTYAEAGTGAFTVDPGATLVTLGSGLSSFNFTTDLTIVYSLGVGPVSQPFGSVSYGLSDLSAFSATLDHGMVTSLSFTTYPKAAHYGSGSYAMFDDQNGSAGTYAQGTHTTGLVSVLAPVPEPATWLTAVMGFGLLGTALRRRRASGLLQV